MATVSLTLPTRIVALILLPRDIALALPIRTIAYTPIRS